MPHEIAFMHAPDSNDTEVNGLCPMLDGRAPRESREDLLKRLLRERGLGGPQ
jgi:hypothetical protein